MQLAPLTGEPWVALAEPWLMPQQRCDVSLGVPERLRDAVPLCVAPGPLPRT